VKTEFAEKFDDKEAAFNNIIFQNGLINTLGFDIAANNGLRMLVITALRFTMSACIMCRCQKSSSCALLYLLLLKRAKDLYEREREDHQMKSSPTRRESFAVKQGKLKLDPSSNDIVHVLALNL